MANQTHDIWIDGKNLRALERVMDTLVFHGQSNALWDIYREFDSPLHLWLKDVLTSDEVDLYQVEVFAPLT